MFQAKVLFDFEAKPEFGEINLIAGEVVTVTNQEAGDGWWQGTNGKGEAGLFPINYVEPYDQNNDTSAAVRFDESSLRPSNDRNKNLHYRDSCWVWPDDNGATQTPDVNINVLSESDDDSDNNDETEEAPDNDLWDNS